VPRKHRDERQNKRKDEGFMHGSWPFVSASSREFPDDISHFEELFAPLMCAKARTAQDVE
jgi:hypothetical protein